MACNNDWHIEKGPNAHLLHCPDCKWPYDEGPRSSQEKAVTFEELLAKTLSDKHSRPLYWSLADFLAALESFALFYEPNKHDGEMLSCALDARIAIKALRQIDGAETAETKLATLTRQLAEAREALRKIASHDYGTVDSGIAKKALRQIEESQ